MFGHAEGKKVANSIIDQLNTDGAHIQYLTALGSDGPNVNKTIFTAIDSHLKEAGFSGLINIGTCNLHVVHNSFAKGLEEYGLKVDELAVDIHSFFKLSSARREDFSFYQLEEDVENHVFLRHVPTRWLTLADVIARILEQWSPLCSFFLDLAKKENTAPKSTAFKRICTKLQTKSTLPELLFLQTVIPPFQEFLRLFQTQSPLIHVLYSEMQNLALKLLSRFMQPRIFEGKEGPELTTIDLSLRENQLDDHDLVIGEKTKAEIRKLEHGDKKRFFLSVRKFYASVGKHLIDRLPFKNQLLQDLSCLQPGRRRELTTRQMIQRVGRAIPSVNDDDIPIIFDEWCLYQKEELAGIDEENQNDDAKLRVDHYWRRVFQKKTVSGEAKYPKLEKLVKVCLILPHGNADCERGLSKNKRLLGNDKTNLSVKSIVGKRMAKEAVALYKQPEQVPITTEFIQQIRYSHQKYRERLEKEKEQKDQEVREKKKKLEEKERREREAKKACAEKQALKEEGEYLEKEEKSKKEDLQAAESLLKEGNDKLRRALKSKDMAKANQAQLMLEKAQSTIISATTKLDEIRKKLKNVETKKRKNLERSDNNPTKKKKN